MLKDLAKLFSDLRDVVTEPVRATIVRRFCRMLMAKLQEQGGEAAHVWAKRDQAQFIRNCKITDGLQAVRDDLDVSATELAHFCDRWLSVAKFREPLGGGWAPFTANMNSLRVTMIEELQELAKKKFEEEA